MRHEDVSSLYLNVMKSTKYRMAQESVSPSAEYLRSIACMRKFVEGEGGWLFLIGDTNDQMAQQFGFKVWTDQDASHANKIIDDRILQLPRYNKFVVPQKSVAYREYLPKPINTWQDSNQRPALRLGKAYYLLEAIQAAKPLGHLYFRGDTHPNWLGSYVLYREICSKLEITPLRLHDFNHTLAGYDGDLFGHHMTDEERKDFLNRIDHPPFTLDVTDRISLSSPEAKHIGDEGYSAFSRETLVFEHIDKRLPKAVVFRDSTCQFMTDWLAEHFSRTVFVWHLGDVLQKVIEREQPDIVIQIMAERFVWTYPSRAAIV